MEKNLTGKDKKDFLFIGFALFAMFFGAGNLIFPPQLGVLSGTEWFSGFFSFFIMDAGLATLGVFAMMKHEGNIELITSNIGKIPGKILAVVVMLCIGPCIAIPRTGTVTFSLGLVPITGIDAESTLSMAIFSIVFFAIVFVLSIKPSKVVDIIGKILTPVLLIFLVILIIKGIVSPAGTVSDVISTTPIKEGVYQGYQTMDAMASLLFAGIIIMSVYDKGYKKGVSANREVALSSVVSCVLLFVVYGGLTYLGATTGSAWVDEVNAGTIDQAALLVNIVDALMGKAGIVFVGIVVLFACLTTAIGLTTSISEYFSEMNGNKIEYKTFALGICIISALLCNIGLNEIINMAAPILSLVYPLVIVLMILGLFKEQLKTRMTHFAGGILAFVISAITVLVDTFEVSSLDWIHTLPLDEYGFNWLVPSLAAIVIALVAEKSFAKSDDKSE